MTGWQIPLHGTDGSFRCLGAGNCTAEVVAMNLDGPRPRALCRDHYVARFGDDAEEALAQAATARRAYGA